LLAVGTKAVFRAPVAVLNAATRLFDTPFTVVKSPTA
jgi:hypothetical protein